MKMNLMGLVSASVFNAVFVKLQNKALNTQYNLEAFYVK